MPKTVELDQPASDPGPWTLPPLLSVAIVSSSRTKSEPEQLCVEVTQLLSKENSYPARVHIVI